jgi:single-strand DNA-binding protein
MMNKVILIGRLTKDSETRYTTGAEPMAIGRFTLAVDRRGAKEGQQTADFISCVAFGKRAEFFEKYGKKGTKFAIEGRIQTGSYTNKDGQKVYTTDVVVDQAEFAESKKTQEPAQPSPADNGFVNVPEGIYEELPFV